MELTFVNIVATLFLGGMLGWIWFYTKKYFENKTDKN